MEAVATQRRANVARVLLAVCALVVAAVAVPLLVYELTRSSGGTQAAHVPPLVSAAGLEARTGVRVVRVAVSGDGGLLDLRYQVVDADKAQSVHEVSPMLIDERTGGAVNEVLMGHIHSGAPKAGLTYYLLFVNPGTIVRRGGRVTVQLGDARLAHVPVR